MDKFAEYDSIEALQSLRSDKVTAYREITAATDPSDEQIEQAEALGSEIDEIDAEITQRQEASAQREARIEALKGRTFASDDEDEDEEPEEEFSESSAEEEPEEEAEESPEGAEDDAEGAESAEAGEDGGLTASAQKQKTSKVAAVAARTGRPKTPEKDSQMNKGLAIVASANAGNFTTGQHLSTLDDIREAALGVVRGFPNPVGNAGGGWSNKHGIVQFRPHFEKDLVIDRGTDDMEVLKRAANESRLEGGALTADGWCAPSETMYDLQSNDSTLEGILSLPEVQVRRGGIRYTKGPSFADFYANPGFKQTEAQAIAGTTKPSVSVTCPTFTDVRLDAIGPPIIRVPILTNAAYPEVVNDLIEGTMVAHAHWVNADVISRLETFAGAARVFSGLGATVTDTLEGLTLIADQRRNEQRMSLNKTFEVVVPYWVKGAMLSDIARRFGTGSQAVAESVLNAHFAARNLKVSYVYDWQPLPTVDDAGTAGVDEANTYPTTFNALMYPAGTFVKGVSDVISLQAVYDHASLEVNEYTGLFMEQGLLVAQMKNEADLVTLPVCNAGRQGAADLTCV